MEIVVNDTNIFIDLYSIGILELFFELPFKVHTADFVINELIISEQHQAIIKYVDKGKLKVKEFNPDELMEIVNLQNKAGGNVSLTDCSVWYYSLKNNYILLTGDGQLRKKATASNVTVKGIIYIFDQLVSFNLLTPSSAADKLSLLSKINSRLPKSTIEERIVKWTNMD